MTPWVRRGRMLAAFDLKAIRRKADAVTRRLVEGQPVMAREVIGAGARKTSLELATTPRPRHICPVKTTVELDASNRIVHSRELRRAAGIARKQKLNVSATPGRIVLELESNASGRIVKRGKLKIWTGDVPATPIDEAVASSRDYTRMTLCTRPLPAGKEQHKS